MRNIFKRIKRIAVNLGRMLVGDYEERLFALESDVEYHHEMLIKHSTDVFSKVETMSDTTRTADEYLKNQKNYFSGAEGEKLIDNMLKQHVEHEGVFPEYKLNKVTVERYGGFYDIRANFKVTIQTDKPVGFKGMVSTWYLPEGRVVMKVGRVARTHIFIEVEKWGKAA